MMHTRGRHQVAHVVHLEIQRIAERLDLVRVALAELHVGVNVSIRTLRLGDDQPRKTKPPQTLCVRSVPVRA
jgi:hypothetical protein